MPSSSSLPDSNWVIQPALDPISPPAGPGGFSPTNHVQTFPNPESGDRLMTMAEMVLSQPLLLQQLSDRVYALLLDDLRQTQERHLSYGGRI